MFWYFRIIIRVLFFCTGIIKNDVESVNFNLVEITTFLNFPLLWNLSEEFLFHFIGGSFGKMTFNNYSTLSSQKFLGKKYFCSFEENNWLWFRFSKNSRSQEILLREKKGNKSNKEVQEFKTISGTIFEQVINMHQLSGFQGEFIIDILLFSPAFIMFEFFAENWNASFSFFTRKIDVKITLLNFNQF